MKKRVVLCVTILAYSLVLMLLLGLCTRGGSENDIPAGSDSGEIEVDGVEISPDLLFF